MPAPLLRPLPLSAALLLAVPAHAQNVDADCSSKAVALVDALARRDFSGAVTDFNADMKRVVPANRLRDIWNGVLTSAGDYQRHDDAAASPAPPPQVAALIVVPLHFAKASLNALVSCSADGQVAGFFLQPRAAPATTEADTSAAYTPSEVRIPSGSIELRGTYREPKQATAPFPVVVIVGGSGPTDRDGSAGTLKPLRDIAQALAEQGIATLAYDKRTHSHPNEPIRTIDDEYTADGVAVLAYAASRPNVDKSRIFFLGHSQGATLAPRVAQRSTVPVAGLILLAPSLEPLETALSRQLHYLAEQDGKVDERERAQLAQIDAEVEHLKQLQRGEAPQGRLPLGVPAAYWQSLWGYDVLKTAREVGKPVLALFGEKDYQVLAEPTAAALNQGLQGALSLSVTKFPQLGHLLVRDKALRVDQAAVVALAAWIKAETP